MASDGWSLGLQYELCEPVLLGQGSYGPVVRARDLLSSQQVAVKVYDAAESFRSAKLAECTTLARAEAETVASFEREVRALQRVHRVHGAGEPAPVAALLSFSCDSHGAPARAADGCCYIVLKKPSLRIRTNERTN